MARELFFVALLIRLSCPKHLIVLRFIAAFFVHLRSLASSFGIFIFTERIRCLPSGRTRHGIPIFRFGHGFEVLFPWIDLLFTGQLTFSLLIVSLAGLRRIMTVDAS